MLILYDLNKTKIAGLKNYKDLRVERELSGDEVLFFSYPQIDSKYDSIKEETYIRTKKNEYVIKEINIKDDWTEFVGKVNVEDLKGKAVNSFETVEQTCTNSVNLAIAGTGWTIGACDVTKKRTVRKTNCSSYDILQEIKKAYLCDFKFDAINKKIYIYQSMGSDKGSYFSDKLNLKKLDIQSNSYDFCTRIIPIGKDGLKINNINSGKEYVENYQYSNKVITVFWEDNRYTVVENLKEDAAAKLNELSKPIRAYSAEIFDLANLNDKYRNILGYDLGDTITLLYKDKKVKEKQRIVKIIEYPDEPERNSCEIANRTLSFEDIQADTLEAVETVNSVTTSDGMIDNSKVDFNPLRLEVVSLVAQKADIGELNAAVARIGTLEATKAAITDLTAAVARIGILEVGSATVTQLNAANAKIATLETRAASIDTLLAGNLTADNMKANLITAGTTLIADGSIASAKIISLSVDKILAGDISTNKFKIVSTSGNMLISDNTIQIKDSTRVRVQIGKDASNDYNMYVWDSSGNLMFDATGLKASGIKSKIIRDDMVSDTANINATKIEKESLVTRINGATSLLLASKVKLDTENQTLEVAFNSLKSTVTTTANTVTSQGTSISTIQGQIQAKIWQQDITTAITDISSMTKINGVELLNQTYVSNTAVKPFTYGIYTVVPASELGLTDNKNLIKCTNSQMLRSDFIPFVPGKPYYVTLSAYNLETTNGVLYVGIEYYDKNKVSLGSNDLSIYAFSKATTDLPANTWKTFEGYVNTDSSRNIAGYIRLRILTRWSSLTGVTYLKDISIRQLGAYINSEIETRMTSTETSITQINSSIALKVSTSDFTTYQNTVNSNVTALSTRVSTAEGSISLLQNQISLKVEQSDIITAINNVSIGGKNLLRNTGNFKDITNWASYASVSNVALANDANYGKVITCLGTTVGLSRLRNTTLVGLKQGSNGTYTISIIYKTTSTTNPAIGGKFAQENGSENTIQNSFAATTKSITTLANGYSKLIAEVTLNVTQTEIKYCYFYIFVQDGTFTLANIKVEEGNKATDWSPAPEDVTSYTDTQISTAKAEIKITTDSISSTVSSVQSSVTSLGTRITSAEGSITTLQNQISLKVTQTEVNNSINALNIGTRNLLQDSSFELGTMVTESVNNGSRSVVTETSYIGSKSLKVVSSASSNASGVSIRCPNLTIGQKYTVSLWVKCTTDDALNLAIYNASNWNSVTSYVRTTFVLNTWTKVSISFIAGETGHRICLLNGVAKAIAFYVDAVKVEIGDKATDYTVAIEDTQGQIDSALTRISAAELKITDSSIVSTVRSSTAYTNDLSTKANQSSLDSTNSNVTNLSTRVTSTESSIVQLSSSIALKVNVGDFGTLITQNASNVRIAVGQIGGTNLLKGTDFSGLKGSITPQGWWYWGNAQTFSAQGQTNYDYAGTVYIQNPSTTTGGLWQNNLDLKPNTKYTLSLAVNKESVVKGGSFIFEFMDSNGNNISNIEITLNFDGIRHSYTFITPSNFNGAKGGLRHLGSYNSGGGYLIAMNYPKLEEGENATAWSPHPSELKNTTVDISNAGLTVRNGAISILNNVGTQVLSGDTSGNLTIRGDFTTYDDSTGNVAIRLSKRTAYFYDWDSNAVCGEIFAGKIVGNITTRGMVFGAYRNKFLQVSYQGSDNNMYPVIAVDNGAFGSAGTVTITGGKQVSTQNLYVSGSKNCIQRTHNYGDRLLYAYETTENYFGDLGFGKINEDGECVVSTDEIFGECVNTNIEYHVFTQIYQGAIAKIERYPNYFVVRGEIGTEFSWELKAKRAGFEHVRLEQKFVEDHGVESIEDELKSLVSSDIEEELYNDLTDELLEV